MINIMLSRVDGTELNLVNQVVSTTNSNKATKCIINVLMR